MSETPQQANFVDNLAGRVRRSLTPLVRGYIRRFPIKLGKQLVWSRVVAPYYAWRSYQFVAPTSFGKLLAGDTIEMLQQYVYFFGVWEPDLTRWITMRLAPGDTFVDVGANIGYYSLLASRLVGESGRVVAIEASPQTFQALQSNLARNSVRNVRAINMAASDAAGVVKLFSGHVFNIGLATVIQEKGFEFECEVETAPVTAILQDDEAQKARLVKIDVEGVEMSVVRGMASLLRSGRPDLEVVVEMHPEHWAQQGKSPEDFLTLFAEAGYQPYLLENDYSPTHYLSPDTATRPMRIRSPAGLSSVNIGTLLVFSRQDADCL